MDVALAWDPLTGHVKYYQLNDNAQLPAEFVEKRQCKILIVETLMVTPTVAQDGDGVGLDLSKEDVQKLAEDAKKSRCFIFYCSNSFFGPNSHEKI